MEHNSKKLNRLLSILLCLCMVLSLIPATVSAAAQVSIPGSFNGWNTTAWVMTSSGNNIYTYQVDLEANTYEFKILDNGSWLGNNGTIYDHTNGYEWIFGSGDNCKLAASGGTYTFTYNSSTKGLKVERSTGHEHDYDVTFSWSDYNAACTAIKSCDCGTKVSENCAITKTLQDGKLTFTATCAGVSDSVTVDYYATEELYVDVSAVGWTKVNAYYWRSTSTQSVINWPGVAMTHVRDSVYCIEVPADCDRIIFNNGSAQTDDLNMPTQGENIAVMKSDKTVSWGYKALPSYTLTFTDDPEFIMADWSYSITKPYGAPITEEDLAALEAAIPEVENYNLVDWYLTDGTWTDIPATMPNCDLTFYGYWEGVRSTVYFYSDPGMSEDSYLSASEFLYDETYSDLETFVLVNCLKDYIPEGYHVAAIKYADGTNLEFPYVHGAEGFNLYVEFAINACETHTEVIVPGYAATCTETGLTDGVKCSVCGETITAQEEIPALGHTEETVPGKEPTCTETGLTDGAKCTVCGETVTAQKELPATGHSFVGGICSACGAEQYMTVYFQNNWLWSDVKLYFWGSKTDTNPEWSGNPMTYYGNDGSYDYYVMEVPVDISGMLINGIKDDGSGNLDKTPDIASDWYDGICYYLYWEDNGNKAGSFNITDADFSCKHVEETVPGYDATCTETGLTDGVICALCGETIIEQEEIPALGHEEPVYTNDGNDHDVDYPCCDDLDDVGLPHSFTDGKCLCGAPEFVQVTVTNDYGTADTVTLSNTVATPGQDYVTTVTSTVGTGIYIRSIYVAIEDSWHGRGIFAFDTETNTLTVRGDYVAEGMKIEAIPVVTLTAHLNGGSVNGDYWEYTYKPDENGVINLNKEYGGAGKFFGAYATCFVRDGYKLVGYNTAPDGTGTAYALDEVYQLAEDLEIWLIWECDHKWNDATCTEPKTCSACGETEGEALGHKDEDNNGRCDTCSCLMNPAHLCMVSTSLKGNIALNYYMLLSDAVLADETAYMQFTMADGEIVKIPVAQGVKHEYEGETYYVFTCAVAAKEMTDTVLSQFFYAGGVTKEHSYSVQTYAKHILTNYDDAATKNLVTAMLNYGAASQLHFGYNTDQLANAGLAAPDYSNVTIDGFKAVAGQGTELAKLYSASLILKSETTLRIFFKVDSSVENLTVSYNGQALEVQQRSGLSYVDVVGISAKALDENVTVTVNDGTNTAEVSFNPMSYGQGVLNDATGTFGQDMKDLVAALYLYNQAANVYFKEV